MEFTYRAKHLKIKGIIMFGEILYSLFLHNTIIPKEKVSAFSWVSILMSIIYFESICELPNHLINKIGISTVYKNYFPSLS